MDHTGDHIGVGGLGYGAMGGREDVSFQSPFAGFSPLAGVAVG
jgi:hypothetical protein